jgi:hypothetical protein
VCSLLIAPAAFAQSKSNPVDKFRQLEEILPTPNEQRTASGAPGARYWQQRADYDIKVTLDDARQRISGSETVTYYNNSPDTLSYIWLQLDNNIFSPTSDDVLTDTAPGFAPARRQTRPAVRTPLLHRRVASRFARSTASSRAKPLTAA